MKLLLLDRPKDIKRVKNRDIEYFGPWAQPIDTPEDLARPAFEPYPTSEAVYNASSRTMDAARDILSSLSEILPEITGIRKSPRFWNLYLGHHIITLAGIIEDIKMRHSALRERDYILGVPCIDDTKNYIPNTWQDAMEYFVIDNRFRLYCMALYLKPLYSNHEMIGYKKIVPQKLVNRVEEYFFKLTKYGYKKIVKKIKTTLFRQTQIQKASTLNNNRRSLIWEEHHLPENSLKKLNVATLDFYQAETLPSFDTDAEKREKLKECFPHPYGELLAKTLPKVALEGLPYLVKLMQNQTHKFNNIKRIYTHGQAFAHEAPKRALVSLLADEGKEIVSIQHGCGHAYFAHPEMFIERMIVDKCISWGKGYENFINAQGANKIEAIPSIYLSHIKKKNDANNAQRKKWNALFVVLEENRYIKWLYSPLFPDMAYDYFRRQKLLFDYFNSMEGTAIKVYPVTYGWMQAKWIREKYPNIELLKIGDFLTYSLKSRVVIIDYIGTGFLELLAMKRPFFATWNRRWFRGVKSFEEHIDKLTDVGVFYDKPQELIEAYRMLISSDIDAWWGETKRQQVLKEMADHFALTSDNVYEEWGREFNDRKA